MNNAARIVRHSRKDADVADEQDMELQFQDWLQGVAATREELAALVRSPQYTLHEIRQGLRQSRVTRPRVTGATKRPGRTEHFHDHVG